VSVLLVILDCLVLLLNTDTCNNFTLRPLVADLPDTVRFYKLLANEVTERNDHVTNSKGACVVLRSPALSNHLMLTVSEIVDVHVLLHLGYSNVMIINYLYGI